MPNLMTSDNTNIYYEIKGHGDPIVFIHGFTENHNSFRIQQKVLSKRYKVISYDLRGHGKSDRVEYGLSLERFALDLRELIDYLQLEKIVLVGWSMGTAIIFEYVKLFGIEKLSKICIIDKSPKVINDSTWKLGLYHGRYTMDDGLRDLDLIKSDWMKFANNFISLMAPYFTEKQIKIAMEKMKDNSPNVMYHMWKSMIEKDYRDILEKITIPSLIVFGEKSTFYSAEVGEYLLNNIKYSNLEIFQDCTHLLVLENPIKFNRVLEAFINNKTHNL